MQPYVYTKLEENRSSSSRDVCLWKVPHFVHIKFFFLFFEPFYKTNFESIKDALLVDRFLTNLAHLAIRHFVACLSLKFEDI